MCRTAIFRRSEPIDGPAHERMTERHRPVVDPNETGTLGRLHDIDIHDGRRSTGGCEKQGMARRLRQRRKLLTNAAFDALRHGQGIAEWIQAASLAVAEQRRDLQQIGSSPSTVADSSHLSCTDPAGNDVAYRLTGNAYSPTDSLAATTALVAEVVASPAVGPDVDVFSLGSFGSKTTDPTDVSFDMSAPDASVTLGTLAKNNIPPIANAGGGTLHTYGGNEGSPITFDGSGSSSVCGFPTLRWDFSDGGVAFGKNPQHTFQGPGTYSGLMTATDATGLTSTSTFSIEVGNLAPVVGAGPDTTAAWGRSVAFNGSATDPGKDDQSTLTYSWSFGDDSPVGVRWTECDPRLHDAG